jgi:hypothetical protein
MQNLTDWDVKQKRDFSPNNENHPVYVQGPFGDQTPFPVNYEYSGDAPARLNRTIDALLLGPTNRQNFINLFYSLPEVFAPVHEIASRVASATWQLKKKMDDSVVTNDADFNRLFDTPNPLMSHWQLAYQAVCYEILTGQNLEYKNIPSTLPQVYQNILTWSNIPTQQVSVNKKSGVDPYSATSIADYVNYYEANNRRFEPDKVLNITNHDLLTGNRVDGFVSQLIGAKLAIRNLIPVYEARGVIYIKRGALGFIVSGKSDESGRISLTPKEKEEVQKEFQNTYGLSANKHQVGVTSSPVDFIKTAMSIKELQPFDETLADALAIYATLRVPRHLCPSKEQSTYANADADMKNFYGDVIIPMAEKYAEKWTAFLGIPNRYIYADFSKVMILQEDKKDKETVNQIQGNVYIQRFTTGVCSLNDWIRATGEEPSTNPLYDKKIFDMTPEELDQVKSVINLKAQSSGTPPRTITGSEPPLIE